MREESSSRHPWRLSDNYALHKSSFALSPASRHTVEEAWIKATGRKQLREAVVEVGFGLGTFLIATFSSLLLGVVFGQLPAVLRMREQRRQEEELRAWRARAAPPKLGDAAPAIEEGEDMGFAPSA